MWMMMKPQISPLFVGLGTHITLSRNSTLSSLADFISLLTSSTVGSRLCLYLARGCYLSYCLCRFPPTVSRALIIIDIGHDDHADNISVPEVWDWVGPPSTPAWHRAVYWSHLVGLLSVQADHQGYRNCFHPSTSSSMSTINTSLLTTPTSSIPPAWSY